MFLSAIFDQKIWNFSHFLFFSQFFVIKTLDLDPDPHPDPHWPTMLDPLVIGIETNADPKHW